MFVQPLFCSAKVTLTIFSFDNHPFFPFSSSPIVHSLYVFYLVIQFYLIVICIDRFFLSFFFFRILLIFLVSFFFLPQARGGSGIDRTAALRRSGAGESTAAAGVVTSVYVSPVNIYLLFDFMWCKCARGMCAVAAGESIVNTSSYVSPVRKYSAIFYCSGGCMRREHRCGW